MEKITGVLHYSKSSIISAKTIGEQFPEGYFVIRKGDTMKMTPSFDKAKLIRDSFKHINAIEMHIKSVVAQIEAKQRKAE